MKTKLCFLTVIMLNLMITACEDPIGMGGGGAFSVRGYVRSADETGVEGAEVRLVQNGEPVGDAVLAGEDGVYTISSVRRGVYAVVASKDGYEEAVLPDFEVFTNVKDADITLSTITPGEQTAGYTVSGTVTVAGSETGGSPEGAQVQLRRDNSPVAGKTASAGADGAYTITGVAPGTYTIEVSLSGYDTGAIETFEVSDADVPNKNIQLAKTIIPPDPHTVSGVISVSDSGTGGSPNGASVQLRHSGSPAGSPASAGADGAYTINGVVAGTYTIEVTLAGYDTGTIADFEVSDADVTSKDITLTKTVYTVSGTVSVNDSGSGGSPNNAQVQLKKQGTAEGNPVQADSGGAYTINGVVAGTYTIEVSLAGYDTGTIASFEVSNADVTSKDIQLTKTVYKVSGTVSVNDSGSGGSPNGASVQLKKNNEAVGSTVYADGSGAYTITNVLPGTYTIEVSLSSYTTGTIASFEVSSGNVTSKNIQLTKTIVAVSGVSLDRSELSLEVNKTATLTATVTPDNAANKAVSWSSDAEGVATVNGGLITAVGTGSATITVTTADGGKTASCAVTVAAAEEEVQTITGKTITEALDYIRNLGAAASASYLIKLGQDETNVSTYDMTTSTGSTFKKGLTITVDGAKEGGGTYTVQWASGNSTTQGCLTLSQDVTFILKNVTFRGYISSSKTQSLVWIKGSSTSHSTLKMQDGAVLTGNQASNGGAVYMAGGYLVMEGGSITGNKSSGLGHGVYMYQNSSARIIMTGGSITGNIHKSNTSGDNDVAIAAGNAGSGTLILSDDARIGRIWLGYHSSSGNYGTITIDDSFNGADTVATIDLYSTDLNSKQILKGDRVSSSYNRFTLGASRTNFTSGSGTALNGYYIDSSGYLRN